MKVADVMSRTLNYVTTEASVKDVSRLIFGRGINGVPVLEKRKVIGFITEKDILSRFFPTMAEYVEDPVHAGNFEAMEKRASEVFSIKAKDIMSHSPVTVTQATPLMQAYSLMQVKKIGRLPVVDENQHLIGMITKGDIFRTAVGDELPIDTFEEYHDWLARHYDLLVDWDKRLGHEVPDLTKLFKKEKIKKIVDVGCGTGEHDIWLAEKGFEVYGLEKSQSMHNAAIKKWQNQKKELQKRLTFLSGDYKTILLPQKEQFDGAIFMGNAFAHLANDYKDILSLISKSLKPKNSLIVLQIVNFEKVFKVNNRFLELNFSKPKSLSINEHAFLEFYDPPKKGNKNFTLNMFIFDHDGVWKNRSKNSTEVVNLKKDDIDTLLKKQGFKHIMYYGGKFKGPLFREPFNALESDWLNIIAKR